MSDWTSNYQIFDFDRPAEKVLRMTLNETFPFNTLDQRGHWEIANVWRDIDADASINVAIITGRGKAFSAGGHFNVEEQLMVDNNYRIATFKEARDLVFNIVNCSKPVVSAINGVAVGAGLATALLADVSVAARNATIIDGHTKLGVAAGDHAVICWPLMCGMAKAKHLLLTCDAIDGAEAERIGLVSLVADADELQATAEKVAIKLATGAQSAIRFTKHALNNWYRSMGPHFDASLAMEMLGFADPDVREGLDAIIEKRKPNFSDDSPL
ncbi:MAG: enoyl-CoA hydratase/isomerase family protein [Pseudomonadota bacterium]